MLAFNIHDDPARAMKGSFWVSSFERAMAIRAKGKRYESKTREAGIYARIFDLDT